MKKRKQIKKSSKKERLVETGGEIKEKDERGKEIEGKERGVFLNERARVRMLESKFRRKAILLSLVIGLVLGLGILLYSKNWIASLVALAITLVLFKLFFYIRKKLRRSARIKKIEGVFPDFLGLMASNLRAGMTIDRAMLLSSRPEFAPLDKEITLVGKDIVTGKEITLALEDMSKRIGSEKIKKTTALIISGIRSGGNLAILLEQTSTNMRERGFVEKRAASNVLMYVIFIFFAVAFGAPILFSLSSILVGVLTDLLGTMPAVETSVNLPFTLTKINLSVTFIIYFSLIFLVVIDVLASFVLGLVSKGEEKEGMKYILPLIGISVCMFFAVRILLERVFAGFFG